MSGPAPLPAAEQASYTLLLHGRYAGTQEWSLSTERGVVQTRVETQFGGVLPEVRRVQYSRSLPGNYVSLQYTEGDGRGRASFETTFDPDRGLVTLRQGRDEVSRPLTTDHHDPLSLLLWLRTLGGEERAFATLTGGRALVQRLPDLELGGAACYAYFLRPGGAYAYAEQRAPHRLLRLLQPTDFGMIEAQLGEAPPRRPERPGAGSGRPRRRVG